MVTSEGASVLSNMLHYPQTWTFALVGSILALGWGFEQTIDTIEKYVDKRMIPVVKQSVLELATLGFIGLVIETSTVGHSNSWLSALSEHFLGDHDILFEQFERLHQGLFAVTITFFLTCAILIGTLNAQFQEWDYERRNNYLQFRLEEYDWKLSNTSAPFALRGWNNLAQRLAIANERQIERSPLTQLFDEIFRPGSSRIAEFLRFRERFLVQARNDGIFLPNGFRFSDYLEEHASNNLKKLVTIDVPQQARIWMPVAVVGLFAEAVADMTEGVGNEASGLYVVVCASQLALGTWSLWNFFKMRNIKTRLRPQLAARKLKKLCADCSCEGYTCARRGYQVMRLLPPPYALAGGTNALKREQVPVNRLAVFENYYAQAARHGHDVLFGQVGAAGPDFYLTSMKTNLFNAIVSLAVGTASLLSSHSGTNSNPTVILLALVPAVASIILAPSTFMMYNWATSVESLKDLKALRKVLSEQREGAFRSKIRTLFKLCQIFDTVSGQGAAQCCLTDRQPSWEQIRIQGNPDALLNLLTVFGIVDLDQDGYICPSEAKYLASTLGYRLTEVEIKMLFGLLDSDGDDLIQFRDFASTILYTGWTTITEPEQTVKRVFSFFDVDGDGFITVTEMLERLQVLGFDTEGVEQLFGDIMGSRQGVISRAEFYTYVLDDYNYIQSSTKRMSNMDLSGDAKRLRAARYAQQALDLQAETDDGLSVDDYLSYELWNGRGAPLNSSQGAEGGGAQEEGSQDPGAYAQDATLLQESLETPIIVQVQNARNKTYTPAAAVDEKTET